MLVCCNEGWDQTSQLVSLSQLMLDPYYRTIEGFEVLVGKDFVGFGHPFKSRLGHGVEDAFGSKDFSPVFVQFLDCVYQLLYQFPSLFEFNGCFLTNIAFHAYSLLYGTFIGNCERERRSLDLARQTVSLWTELNGKEQFKNPLYDTGCPLVSPKDFYCDASAARFKLWREFYLRWSVPETGYERREWEELEELSEYHSKNEMVIMEMMQMVERYKKTLRRHKIGV